MTSEHTWVEETEISGGEKKGDETGPEQSSFEVTAVL